MHFAAFCLVLFTVLPARWPHQVECGNPEVESQAFVPIYGVVEEVLDAATLQLRTTKGLVRVAIANLNPASGPVAVAALRRRVEHKKVEVLGGFKGVRKEGVAEVVDGRGDIALALLSSGLARFVDAPAYALSSYTECLHRIAQREAKEKHLGLWMK